MPVLCCAAQEFMVEIQATRTIDFVALSRILVDKASGNTDDFTRLTAMRWLKEFVVMASGQLVGMYPDILGVVLSNISHPSRDIQAVSHEANTALLALAPPEQADAVAALDTAAILATISRELRSEQEPTKWVVAGGGMAKGPCEPPGLEGVAAMAVCLHGASM